MNGSNQLQKGSNSGTLNRKWFYQGTALTRLVALGVDNTTVRTSTSTSRETTTTDSQDCSEENTKQPTVTQMGQNPKMVVVKPIIFSLIKDSNLTHKTKLLKIINNTVLVSNGSIEPSLPKLGSGADKGSKIRISDKSLSEHQAI